MRYLFLHPNFPAQFRNLATVLASNPNNQVVFGTRRQEDSLPNVIKVLYKESGNPDAKTHRYVRPLESAVWQGQAVYRMVKALKEQGFIPDIVFAHSGWGPGLFIKDILPETEYLCYFEWFYHARGTDADFDPDDPIDEDSVAKIRVKNTPILLDLYSCDRGIAPTRWQWEQFPPEFRSKIQINHDGVDTNYFRPVENSKLILPRIGLDLSSVDEIITYVGRGMEPYRGFPQFMEAAYLIQQRRPNAHIVIVGEDRVAYGKTLPDGRTYKQEMLEKFPFDRARLHFTGPLPYGEYVKVIQSSSAHIYLTRPFVLSWSMLEVMSVGGVVIGSDTAPVREVIEDGKNGLLVDFFSPEQIAERVDEVLENRERARAIRQAARVTILEKYSLDRLLLERIQWMHG
ncbi:glycosyltransferase family 4 protein [Pannus brasiliensis CCIBt3594]|uniref:Glycosyltransferase family 4 protein n=1 Tax=Pannus brasiliensis CCIBt3594 TaxID=1427578 RepID=A0AAW9QWU6_9CHRO